MLDPEEVSGAAPERHKREVPQAQTVQYSGKLLRTGKVNAPATNTARVALRRNRCLFLE
jgi:hypothetical protein